MTAYFIDKDAAGTGDGLSPTNAFTTIVNRSVAWANNDMVWVRRTHIESGVNNAQLGGTLGQQQRMWIIGWPTSGAPFYEMRDAAGVSASWDTDNSPLAVLSTYSLNFPTLSSSGGVNAGLVVNTGTGVANMCFDQLGGSAAGPEPPVQTRKHTYLDNTVFLRAQGPTAQQRSGAILGEMGRHTVIASVASGVTLIQFPALVRELIVSSVSVGPYLLSGNGGGPQQLDLVVNHSNSIAYLTFGTAMSNWPWNTNALLYPLYIKRITGIKPYSGTSEVNTMALATLGNFNTRVDDWFGEGNIMTGDNGLRLRLCTSAEALYDGKRTIFIEKKQPSGNNLSRNEFMTAFRKFFNVVSGTPITIAVPIYVDSVAVHSLSNGYMQTSLPCIGGYVTRITSTHLRTGSVDPWTGTKPVGGTPYIVVSSFNPRETGTFMFEISAPGFTNSLATANSSGGYIIYGEPYLIP